MKNQSDSIKIYAHVKAIGLEIAQIAQSEINNLDGSPDCVLSDENERKLNNAFDRLLSQIKAITPEFNATSVQKPNFFLSENAKPLYPYQVKEIEKSLSEGLRYSWMLVNEHGTGIYKKESDKEIISHLTELCKAVKEISEGRKQSAALSLTSLSKTIK